MLGNKIKEMVNNLSDDFTKELSELIADYKVNTRINYNFELENNTINDKLNFEIRLKQGSKTTKKISFNCLSATLNYQEFIIKAIAEIINNSRDFEELKCEMKYSCLELIKDFAITER